MSRIRLAATAAMLTCGLMLVGGTGIANAQDTARLTQVVPMSGTVTKGGKAFKGKQFTGTYTIDKFVSKGGKLYSVGTLKGKAGSRRSTKRASVFRPPSPTTHIDAVQGPGNLLCGITGLLNRRRAAPAWPTPRPPYKHRVVRRTDHLE